MSRVFIETLGCPKNKEDSERMAGLLCADGHSVAVSADEADVIIVNTCGFIEAAKAESIETIFDYAPLRENGKRLIVTGCLTQRYPEELYEELPEADVILGVNDYDILPEIIAGMNAETDAEARRVLSADGVPGVLDGARIALSPRYSSYLKVAEGCSNCCSYCVIPKIRGPYRSVPRDTLHREAERLADEGCKELILIAQDVTYYGKDLYGRFALPDLIRALCLVDGIEWIRLLYCYEERVSDELIAVMVQEPKVCRYIDMPIQHISAAVLARMNRVSTPESIRGTMARLRAAMPDIVIRTTLITGFPGETEKDFSELAAFAADARFGRLGVFAYSAEEGTPAAEMPDQIDAETAEGRRDELMRIQQGISLENNERLVGSVLDVVVDGPLPDEDAGEHADGAAAFPRENEDGANTRTYIGRTRGDAPEIDNAVMFAAPEAAADDIIGTIVKVRVTDAMDYDLVGELA
ncbi:MAG: 30S ribosomal protein S12 methylthiotransferase RimO [Clostridiales Family XIII bacterium]|jgi:ribosomal protein S12 methylthiotransferase|nr:30S ribosomal protein S12 methylthiotransferase RimO [Clostridiales Family XIII bacterium]